VTNPDSPFRLTVVGDDCAVPRKQGSLVGRRGLAGTVLVYKVRWTPWALGFSPVTDLSSHP
jgi:dihydroxyacetone kinase